MSIIDLHQFKPKENIMEIIIKSLDVHAVDFFINQDFDVYSRIMRTETAEDPTVDLIVRIKAIEIDNNHLVFLFPNNSVASLNLPSFYYHMIEVL